MNREEHLANSGAGKGPALDILIVSEVRFLRESMGEILQRTGTISVLGYCADGSQTLSMSRELHPDMVLLDAALGEGISLVRRLRELASGLRVVTFAVTESVESVLAWAEAGVAGYIPSTAAMADLQALIADIEAGRQACSAPVAAGLLRRIACNAERLVTHGLGSPTLTPRELEIVRLIGVGLSNKEIARRLNIGLATTKSHVHNALGKLNVQRRGQAATLMHTRLPLA